MRLPRPVREALRPIVGRVPVPVLSGVNRGRLWSLASAGSGYATGRRGREQMQVLDGLIAAGDCMWDVGAHHGYMTLAAARRAGAGGQVYAFEPSRRNHRTLRRHLAWNGEARVEAFHLALGDEDGTARFGGAGTSKMLALGGGDEVVTVARGATLVETGRCRAPSVMKIDVEGAEGAVLRGLDGHLPPHARLVVAVHSREAYTECEAVLTALGFRLRPSAAMRRCLDGRWASDPDLLALGPACREVELPPAVRAYFGAA